MVAVAGRYNENRYLECMMMNTERSPSKYPVQERTIVTLNYVHLFQVHKEIGRFLRPRRPRGFSTRSVLLSSWRKGSNMSRTDASSRANNRLCKGETGSCKINKKCQEHVTWKSSKRDGSSGSHNGSNSWKSEDGGSMVVVSNMSDSSAAHV